MGYKIELLVSDEAGEGTVLIADEQRHNVLIHAWTAGMEVARVEAKRLGSPILLRILDRSGRLAVTGRVDLSGLAHEGS